VGALRPVSSEEMDSLKKQKRSEEMDRLVSKQKKKDSLAERNLHKRGPQAILGRAGFATDN